MHLVPITSKGGRKQGKRKGDALSKVAQLITGKPAAPRRWDQRPMEMVQVPGTDEWARAVGRITHIVHSLDPKDPHRGRIARIQGPTPDPDLREAFARSGMPVCEVPPHLEDPSFILRRFTPPGRKLEVIVVSLSDVWPKLKLGGPDNESYAEVYVSSTFDMQRLPVILARADEIVRKDEKLRKSRKGPKAHVIRARAD